MAQSNPERKKRKDSWDRFEEQEVEKTQNGNPWDEVHRITKGIFAVILFLFVLCSATVSKVGVLILTANVAVPGNTNVASLKSWNNHLKFQNHNIDRHSDKQATVTNVSYIWALFIVLIAPYTGSVLYLTWKSALQRFRSWKCQKRVLGILLLEMVMSTISTVGLCLLVFCVLPTIDPLSGILYCNMLLCIQHFPHVYYLVRVVVNCLGPNREEKDTCATIKHIVISICILIVVLSPVMFGLARKERLIREPDGGQIALYIMVPIMISIEWIWTLVPDVSLDNEGTDEHPIRKHAFTNDTVRNNEPQPGTSQTLQHAFTNDTVRNNEPQPGTSQTLQHAFTNDTVRNNKPQPGTSQTLQHAFTNVTARNNEPQPGTSQTLQHAFTNVTARNNEPQAGTSQPLQHASTNDVASNNEPQAGTNQTSITVIVEGNDANNCIGHCGIFEKISRWKQDLHDNRLQIYLLTSIWRIAVSFGMVAIIFGAVCDEGNGCIRAAFGMQPRAFLSSNLLGPTLLDGAAYSEPFVIAIITIIASYVCFKSCVVAVKICLEMCFVGPLFLSSCVTLVLVIIFYATDNSLTHYGFPTWQGGVEFDYQMAHILTSLFTLVLLCFTCIPILWSKSERMLQDNRIFFKSPYYSLLVDQSMILNRWVRQCQGDDQSNRRDTPASSNELKTDTAVPKIYLCATMWHEDHREMKQLLTSVLRLEKNQWMKKTVCIEEQDIIDFEVHVFFDDAFSYKKDGQTAEPNEFVVDFREAVKEASCHVYGSSAKLTEPESFSTPYGRQLHYKLPLGAKMVVHLKDKKKIRIKKRWSQVMYMYYLLSYKTNATITDMDNVYILALDGDVDFQPSALYLLVQRMTNNKDVGAACGRIHAIGSGPMIWYQKFEYAVSHWLQKATEHVTGSILCGPGCFTLFRGSALTADNVARTYTSMPTEAKHYLQYDQGEDRWLCTLLLKQGKKLEYIAASDSFTYAPEGFKAFYKQRRRWGPSTMANILDLLMDTDTVTKNNSSISKLYMAYQLFLFITSVLTPGTIFLMILGASKLAYPSLSLTLLLVLNIVPVVLFVLACLFGGSDLQLRFASALSVMYSIIMIIVLVGLFQQGVDSGVCSLTIMFTIFVGGVFLTTALLHPKEGSCVIYGLLYFLVTPSMQMLLIIYSITNLNNVSWGTRESTSRSQHSDGPMTKVMGFLRHCFKHETEVVPPVEEPIEQENVHLLEDENPNVVLKTLDKKEDTFWSEFIPEYLRPDGPVDTQNQQKVKKDLANLRNKMTLVFLLLNAIFVTVVFYLQKMNEDADKSFSIQLPCGNGEDIEPIGMAFTAVFGIMLLIQYVCMLAHRWKTFLVIMASTSLHREGNMNSVKDALDEALRKVDSTGENLKEDALKYLKNPPEEEEEQRDVKFYDPIEANAQVFPATHEHDRVYSARPGTRGTTEGRQKQRPKSSRQRIQDEMKKDPVQRKLYANNRALCEKLGLTEN